jgi:uncharacterized protein (TIGR00251 family)
VAWYRWEADDLILALLLQPRASRNGFAGAQGERLKVRITAPPVDGAANDHLIAWLAKQFGVPRRQVALLQGDQSRQKRVRIVSPQRLPPELGIRKTASPA